MRPLGWGGARPGNGFSRVTSSFQTLSAVCCGKLLVFHTLFLPSLGFMVAQYTPSGF